MRRWLCCGALALLAGSIVGAGASAATPSDSIWAIQAVATPAVAPNGQLTATSCTSATLCISVGVAQDRSGRDTALAESWNGTSWQGQPLAPTMGAVGTFWRACPALHSMPALPWAISKPAQGCT